MPIKSGSRPKGRIPIVTSSSTEEVLRGRGRALQELARGASLEAVLTTLARSAEEVFPDLRCSVLLCDEDGSHLLHGAAPSLPDFYVRAVDGLEIAPNLGSCGAAAHSRERVIVEDVMEHPNWEGFRDLAAKTGFRACWSEPIFSSAGGVLGTFAMYYATPCKPTSVELDFIETTAHLAGIAIERKQTEGALLESEKRFRQLAEGIRDAFWLTDWKTKKVLYISPAYEAIWGMSCQSLYERARSWVEAIHPEDRDRVLEEFIQDAERGRYDTEYRVVREDGSMRWIHDRAFPIRDQSGEVVRIAGVSEDVTQQKEIELSLRQSEERFRQMATAIREIFWLMDWKAQKVLFASPSFESLWGYSLEGLYAGEFEWYDAIHPGDKERVLETFVRDAPNGEYDAEFRLIQPDGSVRWIHERAFPIRDSSGDIYRMAGISEDITPQKEFQLSLSESESRFRQITETVREILRLTDWEEKKILYVSPAYETIWGRTCESLYEDPHSWSQLLHPDDKERVIAAFRNGGEKGDYDEQYRIVRDDGSVRWIHDRVTPIADDTGKVVRLAGIAEDITESKTTELSLRELDGRFQQLSDSIREVVWLTDWANRRMLFVSAAWDTIWGFSREELFANPGSWIDYVHPDDRELVTEAFYSKAELGEYDLEFRIVRPDGTIRWLHERAFPIRDEDGKVYRLAGIGEDITERKLAERRMEDARDELDRQHEDKVRFLTSELLIAEERERQRLAQDLHDGMNQTITLALMKLAQLRENAGVDLRRELSEVERLVDQANRSARSLTFELSPPILHDLGFEPAVQWLVEDIQRTYGITIALEETESPSPLQERVRVLLYRAVRELLINVAKHARARKARVKLRREKDTLHISVADDGVAFDPAAVGRRGIGLNSIRERLSNLGGSMSIESNPGKGTTVNLVAPLDRASPQEGEEQAAQ